MKLFFSMLFSICFIPGFGQNSLQETLKKQMIKDWERAKAYTREYLDAMPADKYSFRATDSVRSFAQQMLHLAQANAGMGYIGTGFNKALMQVFTGPGFTESPGAQTRDSVVHYVNASYDFMIDAIKQMDFSKATEEVPGKMPGGLRNTTRTGWIQKAFEHQTHHRGQCTIYLRLLGIKPPPEKLWD